MAAASIPSRSRNSRASSVAVDARRLDVDCLEAGLRRACARYSPSSSAPATQPTHSSTLRRISAGTSPRTTTSETAKRPPGFSTRNASAQHAVLVGGEVDHAVGDDHVDGVVGQRDVPRSRPSGTRRCRRRPCAGSRAPAPASRRSCRGRTPCRSARRACADSSTSMPPPEPRSSTVSPGFSSASAVGLPQPSDAATASGRQLGGLAVGVEVRRDRIARSSGRGGAAAGGVCAAHAQGRLPVLHLHELLDAVIGHRASSSHQDPLMVSVKKGVSRSAATRAAVPCAAS